jgi:hypothetical protein
MTPQMPFRFAGPPAVTALGSVTPKPPDGPVDPPSARRPITDGDIGYRYGRPL